MLNLGGCYAMREQQGVLVCSDSAWRFFKCFKTPFGWDENGRDRNGGEENRGENTVFSCLVQPVQERKQEEEKKKKKTMQKKKNHSGSTNVYPLLWEEI